jgi:hypothetical protein
MYLVDHFHRTYSAGAARAITLEALHVIRKVLRTCKIELFPTHSAE